MNLINKKEIIKNGMKQTAELPHSIREKLKGEEVILYAVVDLDHEFKFAEYWLVLCPKKVILVKGDSFQIILLDQIARIKETNSLTCTTFNFIASDDLPALLSVRFTRRQKIWNEPYQISN